MRIQGWEGLLTQYIEDMARAEFQWGVNDCALSSARWVKLITGNDYLSDWEGRYSDQTGAHALIAERGYSGVSDIADAHLTVCPVMLARRGDLLLHPSGTLGICTGVNGVFPTEKGTLIEKTMNCIRAWRVD